QVKRNADAFVRLALKAEEDGQLEKSLNYLHRYLQYVPEDTDALAYYALTMSKAAKTPRGKARAISVLQEVLSRAPRRLDVRRQLAIDAFSLGRFGDAALHLVLLTNAFPHDGQLWSLLGHCQQALDMPSQAAESYRKAIAHAPQQIDNYLRLISLLQKPL